MTTNNNQPPHDPTDDFDHEDESGAVVQPGEPAAPKQWPLTPTQTDVLMAQIGQRGQGGMADMGAPLISTSREAAEFLPRTILTGQEIGWFKRIMLRNQIANLGYVNEALLFWSFFAIRPSLDGIGRIQYKETVIGQQENARMNRAGILERLTRGGNNLDNAGT